MGFRRSDLILIVLLLLCLDPFSARAQESWPTALSRMPLGASVAELNRTNCVALLLRAFQSNQTVKALVFMPGATDEFYMFRRAKANLTNASPMLLDAVSALTNQTFIRATFQPPLLLLHTDEDPLEPWIQIEDQAAVEKLKTKRLPPHVIYNDRDWDFLQPILKRALKVELRPWRYSRGSWHFYRHSFVGWNLSGWEALEAVMAAGKTRLTIRRKQLIFEPDMRVRAAPR